MAINHKENMSCKYSKTTKALKFCVACGAGLCSFCGYILRGKHFCNECYQEEIHKEDTKNG